MTPTQQHLDLIHSLYSCVCALQGIRDYPEAVNPQGLAYVIRQAEETLERTPMIPEGGAYGGE